MKKIYNILSFVCAFFAFVPTVQAQEVTKYENGVGFAKYISSPDDNGVYTITLEAFVTGEVSVKQVSKPADIILVLDVTTSMNGRLGTPTRNGRRSYTYQDIVDGDFVYNNAYALLPYYKDGNYYACYYSRVSDGVVTQHFLTPTGGNTDNISDAAKTQSKTTTLFTVSSNNNGPIYTGKTRMREMQKAVKAFIDEIEINDLYEKYDPDYPDDPTKTIRRKDAQGNPTRLTNRIAIITYWGTANTVQELSYFTDISAADMKFTVDNFEMGTRTYTSVGLQAANTILSQLKNATDDASKERWEAANRTLVLFTDGEPTNNDGYNAVVAQTYDTKANYDTKVFTVGMFSSTPSTTSNTWKMLDYGSSNYPNATSLTNAGDHNEDGVKYYYDASGENVDLTAIFKAISQSSGGAGNEDMTEAVSTVDVVSASFTLPNAEGEDEPDESLIHVYTVKCVGGTAEDENIVFETDATGKEVLVEAVGVDGGRTDKYRKLDEHGDETGDEIDVDDAIEAHLTSSVSGGTKKDRINVEGFDFSSNFCGVYKGQPHGYKLVIKIPVKMADDAVGGPATATNTDKSGIYVPGKTEPIIQFETPHVDLPVNLFIQKVGLRKGESAKFMIVRLRVGTTETSTTVWEPVSTVFITQKTTGESPIVKVRGLDPGYVYKIVEDGWSWSYESSYNFNRSDELITNPFIFTNSQNPLIDSKIRHAESKANNVFGTGSKVEYIDSKKTR